MRQTLVAVYLACVCMGLCLACGTIHVKPPARVLNAPLPAIDDSVIVVPLSFTVAELKAELESQVPRESDADKDWTMRDNWGVKWRMRREPFSVRLEPDTLAVSTTFHVGAAACVRVPNPFGKAFCKEVASVGWDTPRDLPVNVRLPLGGSSAPSVLTIPDEPFAVPKLGNLLDKIGFPLREKLGAAVKRLDERIAAMMNPRALADKLWDQLDRPIPVYEGLLLDPHPIRLQAQPLRVEGERLTAVLEIVARPRLITSEADFVKVPMPELVNGVTAKGFHLALEADVRYDFASALITKELKGVHQIQNKKISIKRVDISSVGNKALIKVAFSGMAKGEVYLIGRPLYDGEKDELWIVDVDFTLESRNVLLKTADWMLHGTLIELIEKHAHIKLAKSLKAAKEKAGAAMKRELLPGLRLDGNLAELKPLGIGFNDTGFVVRASADGDVRLFLEPPKE